MDYLFNHDFTYGLPKVDLIPSQAREVFHCIAYARCSMLDLVVVILPAVKFPRLIENS